jgi:hypothetical protein
VGVAGNLAPQVPYSARPITRVLKKKTVIGIGIGIGIERVKGIGA